MKTLILKLGATGDVVRTTPLLDKLNGNTTWITASKNTPLLQNLGNGLHTLSWEQRSQAADNSYDLVINLEDTLESGQFLQTLKFERVFGAFLDGDSRLVYSENSRGWFDLSLISRFGKAEADRLKLENRRTYQDLVFEGMGFRFSGEKYRLPEPAKTDLAGEVAIAPKSGPVWPMKNWAYFDRLKSELEVRGLKVNYLPDRPTLLQHLGDVCNHRVLVSGDSLPMHFALGLGTRCVSLFNCTSPWEIFDYGLQKKIISPLLAQFFFQRGMDERAVTAIPLEEVLHTTLAQLD